MGEVTVGLVVPVVDTELHGSRVTKAMDAPGLGLEVDDVRPVRIRSSGPGKGKRSEAALDIGIAIQALQNAREGLGELRPDMLPHQRERVLIDPRSQLESAKRTIDEALDGLARGGR